MRANVRFTSRPVDRSIAGIASRRRALRSRFVSLFVGSCPRAQAQRSTEPVDLLPRDVDQRSNERAVHRSDPAHPIQPPAEDEAHQDRLRLVVERVAVGHPRCADRSRHACRLSRSLEPAPHLHRIRPARLIDGGRQVEGQPVPAGETANVRRVRRRVRAQPMIHVEDLQPEPEESAQPDQRLEETHRIGAAAHPDEHMVAGREHVVPACGLRDPFENPRDGGRSPRRHRLTA